MKKLIFAMAVAAAGAASAVSFSYQGALKTAEGGPIPAGESNKTITFRLYANPTSGTVLWGRQYAVHLDTNGLFNVELSDTTGSQSTTPKPLTNDLAWVLSEYPGKEKNLYIALDVQGSAGEIRPRQKLLNVPSAGFAADVAMAKRDFSVEGTATIEGLVTAKNGLTVEGGKLTAEKGLTVSDGGLTVTKGGLTVTAGELKAEGGLNVSGAALTVNNGLNVSGGALAFPGGGGIIPKGGIIMWSGSTPPDGWAICNGENNTPDLRGRFIVGYDTRSTDYAVGKTGGEAFHKLNADELPKHNHTTAGPWTHLFRAYKYDERSGDESRYIPLYSLPDNYEYNVGGGTSVTWGDFATKEQPHENRPPYYVLAFIMKL